MNQNRELNQEFDIFYRYDFSTVREGKAVGLNSKTTEDVPAIVKSLRRGQCNANCEVVNYK